MSEQVQVGIIGTSGWTDMMYLPSLTSHSGASVAAICGRNRERAQEIADKYNVPTVFTDYREMIEKGDLDALVVATPDDLHYPMTMAALDAGLHVLCEKPMANNAKQAREMLEKAEEADVKHMILFFGRWMPHYLYLHHLIETGYIGRPFHTHFSTLMGFGRSGDFHWTNDRRRSHGSLAGLGSHLIDMARWFLGDVANVRASLSAFVERKGDDGFSANDSALLLLEFIDGAQATIQASNVAQVGDHITELHYSLFGEKGTLHADVNVSGVEDGAVIRGVRGDGEPWQILPVPEAYWGEVDRSDFAKATVPGVFQKQAAGPRLFVDAILEDKPISPSFYDGFKVQQVIDAALQSAETGRVVTIEN